MAPVPNMSTASSVDFIESFIRKEISIAAGFFHDDEAAGIEPAPGGAKPLALQRPMRTWRCALRLTGSHHQPTLGFRSGRICERSASACSRVFSVTFLAR